MSYSGVLVGLLQENVLSLGSLDIDKSDAALLSLSEAAARPILEPVAKEEEPEPAVAVPRKATDATIASANKQQLDAFGFPIRRQPTVSYSRWEGKRFEKKKPVEKGKGVEKVGKKDEAVAAKAGFASAATPPQPPPPAAPRPNRLAGAKVNKIMTLPENPPRVKVQKQLRRRDLPPTEPDVPSVPNYLVGTSYPTPASFRRRNIPRSKLMKSIIIKGKRGDSVPLILTSKGKAASESTKTNGTVPTSSNSDSSDISSPVTLSKNVTTRQVKPVITKAARTTVPDKKSTTAKEVAKPNTAKNIAKASGTNETKKTKAAIPVASASGSTSSSVPGPPIKKTSIPKTAGPIAAKKGPVKPSVSDKGLTMVKEGRVTKNVGTAKINKGKGKQIMAEEPPAPIKDVKTKRILTRYLGDEVFEQLKATEKVEEKPSIGGKSIYEMLLEKKANEKATVEAAEAAKVKKAKKSLKKRAINYMEVASKELESLIEIEAIDKVDNPATIETVNKESGVTEAVGNNHGGNNACKEVNGASEKSLAVIKVTEAGKRKRDDEHDEVTSPARKVAKK